MKYRLIGLLFMLVLVASNASAALIKNSLNEGESATHTIDGIEHTVEFLLSIPDDDEPKVFLRVNGEEDEFQEDDDEDFPNEARVTVTEILLNEEGGFVEYYFSASGDVDEEDKERDLAVTDLRVTPNIDAIGLADTNENTLLRGDYVAKPTISYVNIDIGTKFFLTIEAVDEDGNVAAACESLSTVVTSEYGTNSWCVIRGLLQGTYTFIVTLDTDHRVEENNEENNLFKKIIRLTEASENSGVTLSLGEGDVRRLQLQEQWYEIFFLVDEEAFLIVDGLSSDELSEGTTGILGGLKFTVQELEERNGHTFAIFLFQSAGDEVICKPPNNEQRISNHGQAWLAPSTEHKIQILEEDMTIDFFWDGMILESYPEKYRVTINGESFTLIRGVAKKIILDDSHGIFLPSEVTECGYFPIMIGVEDEIPDLPDFPDEEHTRVRMSLDKGWNLITLPGELVKFVPTGGEKLLGYVWIVEKEQFYSIKEAKAVLGDRFERYLATHAFWVYSYGEQDLTVLIDPIVIQEVQVKEGWNLLPIISPFVGESINTLDGDCELHGIYTWDSDHQEWDSWSKSATFTRSMVGEGLVVRSSNSCTLEGGILTPPSFPETYEREEGIGHIGRDATGASGAGSVVVLNDARVQVDWIPPGQRKKLEVRSPVTDDALDLVDHLLSQSGDTEVEVEDGELRIKYEEK